VREDEIRAKLVGTGLTESETGSVKSRRVRALGVAAIPWIDLGFGGCTLCAKKSVNTDALGPSGAMFLHSVEQPEGISRDRAAQLYELMVPGNAS
jgi:hypothetical protein